MVYHHFLRFFWTGLVLFLPIFPLWGGHWVGVSKNSSSVNSAIPMAKTIQEGIDLMVSKGGGEVRVSAGTYDEKPLKLPLNIEISGGWDDSFDPKNRQLFDGDQLFNLKDDGTLCQSRTCLTTTQGDHVVSTLGVDSTPAGPVSQRRLSHLIIIGPDLSRETPKSYGFASYGVIIDKPDVQLDFVIIKAGKGGRGLDGSKGTTGSGQGGKGGKGGVATVKSNGSAAYATCEGKRGDRGTDIYAEDGRMNMGGTGGASGETYCGIWTSKTGEPDAGMPGEKGEDGSDGISGKRGPIGMGAFKKVDSNFYWVNDVTGGKGGNGSDGAGGGGGGSGGSWSYYTARCLASYPIRGGSGHDGNWGGHGGGGGNGGFSGGASFALVIDSVPSSSQSIVLFGGLGGMGGLGGDGAVGAMGGNDTSPGQKGGRLGGGGQNCANNLYPNFFGGQGGPGGEGGKGGGGGGGSGGNGGPAVNLVTINNAFLKVDPDGVQRNHGGQGGKGGSGGKSYQNGSVAEAGYSGMNALEFNFEIK